MAIVQSEARVIVALHIKSIYSGCAYAHKLRPKNITLFCNWPQNVVKEYSKTLSAIYYEPGDAATAKVKSWGFTARTDYERAIDPARQRHSEMSEVGTYFESFEDARKSSPALLQKGFTLTQVISDYLRQMGAFIMGQLQQEYGNHLSMNDVEWCVTLAHDWGEYGMKLMRMSMERAGLVQSAISRVGSPHPLLFVPELDAASYRCLREYGVSHSIAGDKLLVADLGIESCHIVVQEFHSVERSKFEVKQVAESVGVLGGRKQRNKMLREHLMAQMLPVQDDMLKFHAFNQFYNSLLRNLGWECCFDIDKDHPTGFKYELPINVQNRWKQFDVEHGNPIRDSYDVIKVTLVEYQTATKRCLDECVALIARQLLSTPDVKAILLVGKLCSYTDFVAKSVKDLKTPVQMVASAEFAASEGAVAMMLDQVLPFTWTGGEKLLKDGAASSSHGHGITGRTSSPELCEVLPAPGSTSPSSESSNALGDGEGSEPSLENKPRNSKVESVVKKYSWDQVLQMTAGLTSRMLGEGGYGKVYPGKFENGKEVAVKVLNQSSQEGKLETFANEVNLLIQVNHVNLVKLLGYHQGEKNVVIYEYAEEGSIGDHLHGNMRRLNDWKERLNIMLQAACGMLVCNIT